VHAAGPVRLAITRKRVTRNDKVGAGHDHGPPPPTFTYSPTGGDGPEGPGVGT